MRHDQPDRAAMFRRERLALPAMGQDRVLCGKVVEARLVV